MENLVAQIIYKLKQLGWKITTMESCTAGYVLSTITNVEGASEITEGGFGVYSNKAKVRMGVPAEVIGRYGVYSKETAIEMANAARIKNDCQVGLGVTGTFSNIDTDNSDSLALKVFYAIVIGEDYIFNDKIDIPNRSRVQQKEYTTDKILTKLNSILERQLKIKAAK